MLYLQKKPPPSHTNPQPKELIVFHESQGDELRRLQSYEEARNMETWLQEDDLNLDDPTPWVQSHVTPW